jgi:glycosyltransferase involved in cell wall biosynthesis
MVHNIEIYKLAAEKYPDAKLFCIYDPLSPILTKNKRDPKQFLLICSFGGDEPVDVILDTIEQLTDFTFVITADLRKLNSAQRKRLKSLLNVRLKGFLSTPKYQEVLTRSAAAIVLTTRSSTQPSGACEALSSNTPLILSKSSLTNQLFGEWAILVENTAESIVNAVRSLDHSPLDLTPNREKWDKGVTSGVQNLLEFINYKE